ncbi:mRNA decay protein, partial [Coemansia biformis]
MDESTLKRHERLQGLQRANVDAWRGLAPALDATGLDANIKKHTGFIKRCRANMGPDGAAQLLREVKLLKLEKYVSEIVPAVLEGLQKCKTSSEFSAAIDVLSALHARFPIQFTVPLVCQALKQLPPPIIATLAAMPPEQRERDEQARLSRQRPVLRAVSEMYLAGLLWGLDAQPGGAGGVDLAAALTLSRSGPSGGASANGKHSAKAKEVVQQPGHCVLVGVLQNLLLGDREHHLSIILATTFAKALRADLALGDGEIADSCACNIAAASALDDGQAPVVSADACRRIRALLHSYLDSAIERQRTLHRGLVRMRESQEERLFNRGVVHAEAKAKLERHTKALEKLSDSVGLLCEALGLAPPQMEDPASAKDQLGIVFDGPSVPGGDESSKGGQWEDDEERMFYTSLLDLRSKIPPAML